MAQFSLDPKVGDEVGAVGHYGSFSILHVYPQESIPGLGTADIQLSGTEFVIPRVPWSALIYSPEKIIQRVLDERFETLGISMPDDVQPSRFDVRSGETFDGDPKISIWYYAKPDVVISLDKARELNRFSSALQEKMEPFAPNYMLQVFAKEDRSLLRAAS
jgi:hypothetical protein